MKKYLVIIAVIAILGFNYHTEIAKAIGQFTRSGFDASSMRTSNSTSTPVFLQTGLGTTTMTFSSGDVSAATLNLQVFASSSSNGVAQTNLLIERQACDTSVSNTGLDCFTYDDTFFDYTRTYPASTTIALASSTVLLSYKPIIQGATTTKAIQLNILPARFTRLIFSLASSSPSATYKDGLNLYADVVTQINGQ